MPYGPHTGPRVNVCDNKTKPVLTFIDNNKHTETR
jgi:hypothetical protein